MWFLVGVISSSSWCLEYAALFYSDTSCAFHIQCDYFRLGTKLYRQIVGIPMAENCAPIVADLALFC